MDEHVKTSLWQQFGAAVDTLDDVIRLCTDELWTAVLWDDEDDSRYGTFWFLSYHTLSWLDLFLTGSPDGFKPPPPFIRGVLPDEPYTKEQVLGYLALCRQRGRKTIEEMTDEKARQRCLFPWMEPTFLELQLYSMRHVQEHAAQFAFFLGQRGVTGMDWVAAARENPN